MAVRKSHQPQMVAFSAEHLKSGKKLSPDSPYIPFTPFFHGADQRQLINSLHSVTSQYPPFSVELGAPVSLSETDQSVRLVRRHTTLDALQTEVRMTVVGANGIFEDDPDLFEANWPYLTSEQNVLLDHMTIDSLVLVNQGLTKALRVAEVFRITLPSRERRNPNE